MPLGKGSALKFWHHSQNIAKVRVDCEPSGGLIAADLAESSGDPTVDDAAFRAVRASDPMPVHLNGKAPRSFAISLRPTEK
ncbi:TonB family protein [Paraburkholderia youngii]|uniref:TonB family protein n=1 Tax=Paraburkholderia youngii TaxID=2782701 RepID=UPI003D20C8B2